MEIAETFLKALPDEDSPPESDVIQRTSTGRSIANALSSIAPTKAPIAGSSVGRAPGNNAPGALAAGPFHAGHSNNIGKKRFVRIM